MADWLMQWTDVNNNVVNLDNIIDIRTTFTKEAKTNAMEMIVPSRFFTTDGESIFQPGEKLTLYAKSAGLIDRDNPSVDNLLGSFNILNEEIGAEAGTIKVTCSDLTYSALATLFSRDITGKAPDIINSIIQEIAPDGISQISVPTNIASVRSDLSAFPDTNFVSLWKTSYDCITELSSQQHTEDTKTYIFWFDPDGTFNWVIPPSEIEDLELFQGDGISNLKHSKKDAETVAMIIFDAGKDLNEVPIIDFEYNPKASAIKGNIKYQPMTTIADQLKRQGTITDNTEFRNEALRQARIQSQRIIARVGEGTDMTTCEIPGQKVNMAKLHKVKSDSFPEQELRLDRVVHTMNRNGWVTRLELIEDIKVENG
jgi:hypothetical protein